MLILSQTFILFLILLDYFFFLFNSNFLSVISKFFYLKA